MMYIEQSYFVLINIFIIVFVLFNVFNGFRKGMIQQVLSLCGLMLALIISKYVSPIFAGFYELWPHDWYFLNPEFFDLLFYKNINESAWFILILVLTLLVFMFIKPLFKFITKLPILKQINKFLGLFSGALVSFVWLFIFYLVLSTPLITNSREVIDNTLFKNVEENTMVVFKSLEEPLKENNVITKILTNQALSEKELELAKQWLIDNGFSDLPIEEITQGKG